MKKIIQLFCILLSISCSKQDIFISTNTETKPKEIMKEYDTNETGTIDYIEFVQIFTKLLDDQDKQSSESDESEPGQMGSEP